jgi:hypothetical protein
VRKKRGPEPALSLVELHRSGPDKTQAEPDVQPARRFKVVELTTRRTLAEHASTQATVALLGQIRSSVDVHIFVWQPHAEQWRLLTLDEQRALWEQRGSAASVRSR